MITLVLVVSIPLNVFAAFVEPTLPWLYTGWKNFVAGEYQTTQNVEFYRFKNNGVTPLPYQKTMTTIHSTQVSGGASCGLSVVGIGVSFSVTETHTVSDQDIFGPVILQAGQSFVINDTTNYKAAFGVAGRYFLGVLKETDNWSAKKPLSTCLSGGVYN